MKYKKIAQDLKNKIIANEYKELEKLPSEVDFSEIYETSRMTVRKAIGLLVENGLVFVIPKSGYYVNTKEDMEAFNSLIDGSLYYFNKDNKITTKVITFEIIKTNGFFQKKFRKFQDSSIYHISRLRFVDGEPYTIEDIYLPVDLFPKLTKEDAQKSIYAHVNKNNFLIGTNRKKISAGNLPQKYEKLLPQLKTTPLLFVENTGYLVNAICFEYSLSYQINQSVAKITNYQSILR